MAVIKIGETWYQGNKKYIYLVQGTAINDGESKPIADKAHGTFTLSVGKKQDDTTTFITIDGWRNNAAVTAGAKKGESYLAVGVLKTRKYQGKKYYSIDVDWICKSGCSGLSIIGDSVPEAINKVLGNAPKEESTEFDVQTAEQDLPFD